MDAEIEKWARGWGSALTITPTASVHEPNGTAWTANLNLGYAGNVHAWRFVTATANTPDAAVTQCYNRWQRNEITTR